VNVSAPPVRAIAAAFPLWQQHLQGRTGCRGLGLAAAVLEGAGLFLFIPLLLSLGAAPPQPGRWQPIFDRLLAPIPEHLLTAFLVGALCVSIVLKNAVHLVNTWVTRYVDGLVAHQLRSRVFDQAISSCVYYRVGNKPSDIITTIANNTWTVSQGLSLAYRLMVCSCLWYLQLPRFRWVASIRATPRV
jgi:ATP-binding cassette, subfamily B, bacterial MsbA